MEVPFVDLKAQYRSIASEIEDAIAKVITDCAFINGKYVREFEENFAKFCGAKHCIGVGNGTDALKLALLACDVGPGDEVITVSHTFIATAEAITQTGARSVFVDIDDSYCINPSLIENAVTEKTKAIIPVHLYGNPADMNAILEVAKRFKLKVIEDAAQAHGAIYKRQTIGTLGDCACFSFYPGKNLGAFGDAGAVVTNNEEIAKRVSMLRDHGRTEKYIHIVEGFNSRLDGIQAAVLNVKLKHLDEWTEARRNAARKYHEKLSGLKNIILPIECDDCIHVYHLYVIRTRERDRLQMFLKDKGIATGIHYPVPLHQQPAYKYLNYRADSLPHTSAVAKEILSLPISAEISEGQIEYISGKIREFFRED